MPDRRSLPTPVVVIGCALAAVLIVAVAFVAFDIGGGDDGDTAVPAAAETAEGPEAPPEDRLTSESRLGYAGLGPLRLGMSQDDAERAAGGTFEPRTCEWDFIPNEGSGLDSGSLSTFFADTGLWIIYVSTPSIQTISGIHIGSTADDVRRTYSNVVESEVFPAPVPNAYSYSLFTITNPEGRFITFVVDTDGIVRSMSLVLSADAGERAGRC